MKKLLLLLFVAAYLCVSCNKEDRGNCTLKIVYTEDDANGFVSKLYKTSSDNVDFDKSIISLLRRGTITLKNGSLAQAVDSNYIWNSDYNCTSEGAIFCPPNNTMTTHNLQYGSYVLILWTATGNGAGTGNGATNRFLYKNFVFHNLHTSDTANLKVMENFASFPSRKFTEI